MVESAARLLDAHDAVITLKVGDSLSVRAHYGPIPTTREAWTVDRGHMSGRAVIERAAIHVIDLWQAEHEFPGSYAFAKKLSHRTMLAVPLLREQEAIGAILIRRREVRPFAEKQIALLETFADQAVIAIENVRLFEEVQAKTRDLTEALQQQTATAEVLQVISRSAFDLQTVFDALVASAGRLCEADGAIIFRRQGENFQIEATYALTPKFKEYMKQHPVTPDRGSVTGRAIVEGKPVQIEDVLADPEYRWQEARDIAGWRAILAVPLMRETSPIGAIALLHTTPRPFTTRQVELVSTFADQAVIAIENVHLFEQVESKTRDLSEALQQQTATTDVLKIISRSTFDLQVVLDTLSESAMRLCQADHSFVYLRDGDVYRYAASHGFTQDYIDFVRDRPLSVTRNSIVGRTVLERRIIHVPDITVDPEFTYFEAQRRGNYRTILGVPLFREGQPLGVMAIIRSKVAPFTERQIELVSGFADQAVIAIENVRLFEQVQSKTRDLSEALEQQTATGEVLKAISRSTFDLQTVLNTLVESAAGLCGANVAQIFRFDGDMLSWAAGFALNPEYLRIQSVKKYPPNKGSLVGRVTLARQTILIADALADPEYAYKEDTRVGNIRTMLGVPLMHSGDIIGVIAVARDHVEPFTDKQIELVQTFADQAVIAIQNVRLFEEVQTRNRELRVALDQQTATSDLLKVIGRSTFDLQPVFDALAESAVRLCEAERACVFRYDGEFLRAVAWHNPSPELRDFLAAKPIRLGRHTGAARAGLERKTIHIRDLREDSEYSFVAAEIDPVRTILAVPMLRGDELLGVTVIYRLEVRPFADSHIALMETFSDQAVIAIENARLFEQVQARTRELTESLQQQTATADVLKVISRSAFDLNAVFKTLLDSAARLCAADRGVISRREGDLLKTVAGYNEVPEYFAYDRSHPHPIGRGTFLGRAALERATIHVSDVLLDPDYERQETAVKGKFRSVLAVPIRREGDVVGVFGLGREVPGLFTARQIELVETFADQAAIAIENVRLFNEVQARTRELQQSLEYQTATSEVLNVISRSPTELQPVLDVIIETAVRLCEADGGAITRQRDGHFIRSGQYGFLSDDFKELMQRAPVEMTRSTITGRTLLDGKVVHILDAKNDPEYTWTEALKLEEIRTGLGVPLHRHGAPIGAIALVRRTVRPFTDEQIELVTTFADQAVIAIENARLFEEVQARTRELTESLQQQTATADVLKVISRSAFDLKPVLQALIESAARLCDAEMANITRQINGVFVRTEFYGAAPEFVEHVRGLPVLANRGSAQGRALLEGKVIHIPDIEADPEYTFTNRQGGFRTILGIPMMREGVAIGSMALARTDVRPFTDKQIELVSTFADQAAIAIENARLFNEVQTRNRELTEALEQQTATSAILRVIASSPTDMEPVLQTVTENAAKLCEAHDAAILLSAGNVLVPKAHYGPIPINLVTSWPIARDWVTGRAFIDRKPVHVRDLLEAGEDYPAGHARAVQIGHRTILAVPLMRKDEAIGALLIRRTEVRPFSDKQIELVSTFADQAAIAIENVRLFESVEARTRELGRSLENLRSAQDRLIQTEKLASLGQLTAGIAHEIKNPLNFVNNFSALSVELVDELQQLADGHQTEQQRAEARELMATLKNNLDKVSQHGKRADSIVKNMLLHSRQGSSEHRPADINAIVEESLNLAYHGARAEKQGFNITLEKSFDREAGKVDIFPQEITRVFLNLIANGFYATAKRRESADPAYEPVLSAATRNLGDRVEIRIRDNGTGIPAEIRSKLFTPFFTTKPAGEGTGLGLSLSHDIIAKQHAGSISVESEPGKYTEFVIVLPRDAASLARSGGHA